MNRYSNNQSPHIMLVDDSAFDIKLLRLAFEKVTKNLKISAFSSGQDVLSKFFGPANSESFQPDVCFLDLNMPVVSGLDVLKRMKEDKLTKHILIFVLSTSDRKTDINASYQAGADGYLVKPNQMVDLENMTQAFATLWAGPHRFAR